MSGVSRSSARFHVAKSIITGWQSEGESSVLIVQLAEKQNRAALEMPEWSSPFEEQFCAVKAQALTHREARRSETGYLCRPLKAGRPTEYLSERAASAALIGFLLGSVSAAVAGRAHYSVEFTRATK